VEGVDGPVRIETFTLGELQENAYLVLDDEQQAAVVIDPGDYPKSLIARIEEIGCGLTAILLTHGHWDHVAGVRAIKDIFDVPVCLHAADAPLYRHVVEQAELFGFFAEPQPPLDRELKDGDTIKAGPFTFQVLHTPGHTPGGVCYRIGDVVFVGDVIFQSGVGRTDLPGGSYEQLLTGVREKILTLDENTTLYPGHGPATTVGIERATNPFLV